MRGTSTAPRLLALLLFLTLVGTCAYWALQILAPRPAIAPSGSIGDTTVAPNLAPTVRLFGVPGAVSEGVAEVPINIQVSGVAEAGPNGVAILSVDGKPGVAYAVNDTVTDGTTVKMVALDKVTILQRGRSIDLKAPDRASVNVLSSGVGKQRSTPDPATTAPVPARAVAPAPNPPAQDMPGVASGTGLPGGTGAAPSVPSPPGTPGAPGTPGNAAPAQPGGAPSVPADGTGTALGRPSFPAPAMPAQGSAPGAFPGVGAIGQLSRPPGQPVTR